jgi:hypothetical protein
MTKSEKSIKLDGVIDGGRALCYNVRTYIATSPRRNARPWHRGHGSLQANDWGEGESLGRDCRSHLGALPLGLAGRFFGEG